MRGGAFPQIEPAKVRIVIRPPCSAARPRRRSTPAELAFQPRDGREGVMNVRDVRRLCRYRRSARRSCVATHLRSARPWLGGYRRPNMSARGCAFPQIERGQVQIGGLIMSLITSFIVPSLTSRGGAAASSRHGVETYRPVWATRLLLWCARCSARSQQRQALAELDDHFLKDIGVTRQQAIDEAAKPFWK